LFGFLTRASGLCVDYLELDRGEPAESALPPAAVVGPLDPGHDRQPQAPASNVISACSEGFSAAARRRTPSPRYPRRLRPDPSTSDSEFLEMRDEFSRPELGSTVRVQRRADGFTQSGSVAKRSDG
jgi:hypothetical protein